MEEEVNYRVHPNYPNYKIGDDGTVWSNFLRNSNGKSTTEDWHLVKFYSLKRGHRVVSLSKDHISKKFLIHRLVLETFIGPCPDGLEGCHRNGDPTNNNLSNLRWGTPTSNSDDIKAHGNRIEGEKIHNSILKIEDVLEIKKLLKENVKVAELCKKYNVSYMTIYQIKIGKAWKHLETLEEQLQRQYNCHLTLAC